MLIKSTSRGWVRFTALRAVGLTLGKEFRLLWRDRVGLFMLLAAPIVVIAAAGFSLADVYAGGAHGQPDPVIALVNEDHGAVGRAVAAALKNRHDVQAIETADRERARELVLKNRSALLGVIVQAGSTLAIEQGRETQLLLIIDPVRYQQAVRVETGLAEMCRQITAQAQAQAQAKLSAQRVEMIARIDSVASGLREAQKQAQELSIAETAARERGVTQIRQQLATTIAAASAKRRMVFEKVLDQSLADVAEKINEQTAHQVNAQAQLRSYFAQLESAQTDFERWFAELEKLAGSNAGKIPAPPQFPAPPPGLVALLQSPSAAPVDLAALKHDLESKMDSPDVGVIALPALAPLPRLPQVPPLPRLLLSNLSGPTMLPGNIGLAERAINSTKGATVRGFNAFDLEVPGFGVTFLLIGMLMGLSLALIDEHDWGTLARLRSAAAPLGATLIGKMVARFFIGFTQMVILLISGWLMFGMSLGSEPAALLIPSAAIAFAAAAFGLVVAGAGRTRDAVLPIGAIVIMTMAAMGGCWWPIDFEPQWMRTAALALPTTWAMRAFNDLMIRQLPVSAVLMPSAINLGFGILYAAVGAAIARHRFA